MRKPLVALALAAAFVACGESTPSALAPVPIVSATAASAASASPSSSASASSAPVAKPAPPARPLSELQLASLKQSMDAINQHDAERYAQLFTPDVRHREASAPDVVGRTEVSMRMQLLFDSFPDFKLSFDRAWIKANVAVAQWRWAGTDRGGFLSKKPTGRRAGLQGIVVGFYNADGMVREVHVYEDGYNVVRQLDATAKAGSFRAPPGDSSAPAMEVTTSSAGADEDKGAAIVRALYEAIEAKDEAKSAALFADDAIVEDYALPARTDKGPAAWKATLKAWKATFGAFTDAPLSHVMAVADYVVVERVLRGKVSGSDAALHSVDILRHKDGKIVRFETYSNTLELVSKLGARGVR